MGYFYREAAALMKYFTFQCGCKFPIVDELPDGTLRIAFNPDMNEIPLDCSKTWDLFCDGNTKGIFQLETGQSSLTKQLAPRSIEELSALTALLRPGCVESFMEDGKSLTQHYIDRKNNGEPVTYIHPALRPILDKTYGILTYQEQAIRLATDIAGFSLQEADTLRKAIGKKKPEEMAKIKVSFLEGCRRTGIVPDDIAEQIFGWIQASQRYSFNKSHSISYAFNAYLSGYVKAHFIKQFFTSWLYFSQEKGKTALEIYQLVNNARMMYIDVFPPDFRQDNKRFRLIDKKVVFGLTDIKGIGASSIDAIAEQKRWVTEWLKKPAANWTWMEFLLYFSTRPGIGKTEIEALISAGTLRYMGVDRTKMLFDYNMWNELTKKEQAQIIDGSYNHLKWPDLASVFSALIEGGSGRDKVLSNKNRLELAVNCLKTIENPPYPLVDSVDWIAGTEQQFLSIPITCHKIDGKDTAVANSSCRDFTAGQKGFCILPCQVDSVKETAIKTGKNIGAKMGFITISDSTGSMDATLFSEAWNEYRFMLIPGNTIMIGGEKSMKKDGFIIKKIWQL